ncbi:MAG: PQQ-binding-like beta-propeller repeat protein [Planctomycetota bacterium]|jgi:outer membrane protein assembly factor BamB
MSILPLGTAILVLALAHPGGAADKKETHNWPTWRGPNHDGISKEAEWNPEALNGGPKVVWKADVEEGWSAVCIQGEHLYTMGNTDDRDTVVCLDASTGKEVWKRSYDCFRGKDYFGPRATPVWDDGRLYTLSRMGHLHCIDAKKGRVIWKRNVLKEFKVKNIKWHLSGSPRIEGRALLINAGDGGISVDKKTGKTFWRSTGRGGYSTPVVFKVGKRQCVALFAEKEIVVADFRTGRRIWGYTWVTAHEVNASDPVIVDKKMFISTGYGRGCALFDFSRGRFQKVWENKEMASHFGSSVVIDGHIYGPHGNTGQSQSGVVCLDLKTGEMKWKETCGFCSLMAADGKLIILNERGELFVAKADPASYQEISRCRALSGGRGAKCWNMPVLCRGRIYCRNSIGDMVCIDVRK